MNKVDTQDFPDKGLPLRAGLWLAQVLLAAVYLPTGMALLFLPAEQVATIVPWASHLSEAFSWFIASVDLAAGLGVVLPSVTRIVPGLTVLAALCSAALQALALLSLALLDASSTPLAINLAVLVLSLFVAWGRSGRAVIVPRWRDRGRSALDLFSGEQADGLGSRSKAWCRAMVRGLESLGHEVSRMQTQRGLRDAPFIARERKSFCHKSG